MSGAEQIHTHSSIVDSIAFYFTFFDSENCCAHPAFRDGDSGACNPLVEVRLSPFDMERTTRMKTSTFNARFNESLFFSVDVRDGQVRACPRVRSGD
jgi:hypothetical protein